MEKLIKWVDNSVELVLHVNTERGWIPYYAHQLHRPDHVIPGSNMKPSKGFATAQYLLSLGYKYVTDQKPTEQVLTTEELFNARAEFLKMTVKPVTQEEVDNLRCYYKNGQMLLEDMIHVGMIERMAAAMWVMWATRNNHQLTLLPELEGDLPRYEELPESKQAELRMMVRGALGVLRSTFPATNMRTIAEQLKQVEKE